MLSKLRSRAEGEQGFTLIELLVVILIIGILAGIAIPAFLNQRGKAHDAAAKSQVRSAQTAAETYGTDNNGDFSAMNKAALVAIEPTLNDTNSATLSTVTGNGTVGYTVVSTAGGGTDTFTVTVANGVVTHSCTGTSGCNGGTW